jgi:hypothetical protein
MTSLSSMLNAFTPKGFQITAQGRPRSGRTLGWHGVFQITPKGFQNNSMAAPARPEASFQVHQTEIGQEFQIGMDIFEVPADQLRQRGDRTRMTSPDEVEQSQA